MKVEYKEIFKLKDMLDKSDIKYEFIDRTDTRFDNPFYQIVVYEKYNDWNERSDYKPKRLISVIEGWCSFSGDKDLLEIMGCLTEEEKKLDDVQGYLTAKNVFERIKREWNK